MVTVGAKIKIDTKELKQTYKELGGLVKRFAELKKTLKDLEGAFKKLNKTQANQSKNFKKLTADLKGVRKELAAVQSSIKKYDASLKKNNKTTSDSKKSVADLRKELKQLATEANSVDLDVKGGKESLKETKDAAEKVQEELKYLQEETGNTGLKFDDVFKEVSEGVQEAVKLFRDFSETINPNDTSAYAQSIRAVDDGLKIAEASVKAFSISQKIMNAASLAYATIKGVLTGKIKLATAAQWLFNAAQAANPIGLIVGAIVAAGTALAALSARLDDGSASQKKFNDLQKEVVGNYHNERQESDKLFAKLKRSDISREERIATVNKLNAMHGDHIDNLLTEKSSQEDVAKAQEQANQAILNNVLARVYQAKAQKLVEQMVEQQQQLTKATVDLEEGNATLWEHFLAGAATAAGGIISLVRGVETTYDDVITAQNQLDVTKAAETIENTKDEVAGLPDLLNEVKAGLKDAFSLEGLNGFDTALNETADSITTFRELTSAIGETKTGIQDMILELSKTEDAAEYEAQLAVINYQMGLYREQSDKIQKMGDLFDYLSLTPYEQALQTLNETYADSIKEQQVLLAVGQLSYEDYLIELERLEQENYDARYELSAKNNDAREELDQDRIENTIANIKAERDAINAVLNENKSAADIEREAFEERKRAIGVYSELYQVLTKEQTDALVQLQQEHEDNLLEIRSAADEAKAASLQASMNLQLSQLQLEHNAAMSAEGLNKKQRLQLEQDYQDRKIEIQREAIQEQIKLATNALTLIKLENQGGIISEEEAARITELKQLLADLGLQLQSLGTGEDGQKTNIVQSLGLDEEKMAMANASFQAVQEGLNAVGAVFEAQKTNQLAGIDEKMEKEIEAVNSSTLSEEDKAAKIEDIKAKSDAKKEKLERKFKKKQQKLDIMSAVIGTALAVTNALQTQPFLPLGIAMAASAAVTGAVQIATIAKQKFAKGGVIEGPSHAQGGVPFSVGGQMMEAEGGELIVNKGIWNRPDFVRAISDMNAQTGGRQFFAAGGVVPSANVGASASSRVIMPDPIDTEELVVGLRGVIADEVGSLQVVNNVVDTSTQQNALINQQIDNSF